MSAILDASNEYLSYATPIDARNDYTWMTWVKPAATGWQGVLSFSIGEGGNQYESCEIRDTNDWGLYAMDNQATGGGSVSTGTWYHVAMVKSGTTLFLYVNGSAVLTLNNVVDFNLTTGVMLWGHWSTANDPLSGRISYSRAWTAALNATQIGAEMNAASAVVTTALWGDWPLQANANDISANGRNLTVNGTVAFDTTSEPSVGGGGGGGGGGGAVTLVGSNTNSRTAGTSMVLNVPAGTADGHLMVAALWHELANPTITPPSGWTLLFQQNVSTRTANLAVFTRQAGASEPASYTWTVPTTSECAAGIATFAGADASSITSAVQANNSVTASNTAPTINVPSAGAWVLHVGGSMYGTTSTPPANFTEIFDRLTAAASSNCMVAMSYRQYDSTGATGPQAATLANADYNAAALIVIPAAPTGGNAIALTLAASATSATSDAALAVQRPVTLAASAASATSDAALGVTAGFIAELHASADSATSDAALATVRSLTLAASADSATSDATLTPDQISSWEPFENDSASWQVSTTTSGGGTVTRSSTQAHDGVYSAACQTSASGATAFPYATFTDNAGSHSWSELTATYHWQRAWVYIPSSVVAGLGATEYFTLAGFWCSATATAGWWLRVRQNGALYVYGYDANGTAGEYNTYMTIPTNQWVELEIGLKTQSGPGIKRAFSFLIDGAFHGWVNQGRMVSEIYNRVAIGILGSNTADALTVYVDSWEQQTTASLPTGSDNRSTANVQEIDYRDQSGENWEIDWSTWRENLTMSATAGLYSASNRLQCGLNEDRLPNITDGWAEIEIDWPSGTPNTRPSTYESAMVGFRKNKNAETNLEVYPIGDGTGNVLLTLEAWTGSGTTLAQWQMPLASIGGGSRIAEPGDIIRARWEDASATQLRVRVSYYDASAATWYADIIDHTFTATNIGGVNFMDGYHVLSSITTDSASYAIRRFKTGVLATYPAASVISVTLAATAVSATSNATLLALRNLLASASATSAVSDAALSILRGFALAAQSDSGVSDAAILMLRSLSATASAASTVSDAALAILRNLAAGALVESAVSDATLSILRRLQVAAQADSSTSDAALLISALIELALSAQADSSTSNAALLAQRGLSMSAPATSTASDAALVILRDFALAAQSASSASDAAILVLRGLSLSAPATSTAADAALSILRRLQVTAQADSSTSDATLLISALIELALSAQADSSTSDAALLALRSLSLSAPATSTAADAALSILRRLQVAAQSDSSTSEATLVLTALVELALSAQANSSTSDAALSALRSLSISAPATSTAADATLSILRQFAASALAASATSDATMAVLRRLEAIAQADSSTSAASLVLTALVALALSAQADSGTSNAAILVLRSFSAIAPATSAVSDAALSILRRLQVDAQADSNTSAATLVLTALVELVLSAQANSSTSDAALAALRSLSVDAVTDSAVSDAAMTVLRRLEAIAQADSNTSDAQLTLSDLIRLALSAQADSNTSEAALSALRSLSVNAQVASVTPDAAMTILRQWMVTAQADSSTSDAQMAVLRMLSAVAEVYSSTGDARLFTALITGVIFGHAMTKRPGGSARGRSPDVSAQGKTPDADVQVKAPGTRRGNR